MRTRFSLSNQSNRTAFTLVELLVAMAIFVILATIALSAYRGVSDEDRLRNGAQQIQSMINGARSRAVKDKLPRGVRFIPSTDDPSVIDSLTYLAALPNIIASSAVSVGPNSTPSAARRVTTGDTSNLYQELKPLFDQGAFTSQAAQRQGLRIRLGNDWYRISSVSNGGAGVGLWIDLAEPYRLGDPAGGSVTVTSYEIEVGPVVLTEPPVAKLPQNVVIPLNDLLNNPPQGTDPVVAAVTQPPFPFNYGTQIDIMFGPNGSPVGVNSTGLLRVLLVDRRDHDLGRIWSHTDGSGVVQPAASYEQRVVTFIGSTGQTYASAAGPRPDYFYHARKGQEAKQ